MKLDSTGISDILLSFRCSSSSASLNAAWLSTDTSFSRFWRKHRYCSPAAIMLSWCEAAEVSQHAVKHACSWHSWRTQHDVTEPARRCSMPPGRAQRNEISPVRSSNRGSISLRRLAVRSTYCITGMIETNNYFHSASKHKRLLLNHNIPLMYPQIEFHPDLVDVNWSGLTPALHQVVLCD